MTPNRKPQRLNSVAKIVETYDGVHGRGAFRRLIPQDRRPRTKQQIANYKRSDHLPPDTFLIVRAALKEIGCIAPASLWGITEPKVKRAA